MANLIPATPMDADLNDEGYSDNDPPRDPSIVFRATFGPRDALPPAAALPNFVMGMSEAQRAGTSNRSTCHGKLTR
jgi:hypothetical protein